ncbi:MAG TPA: hypothetical protein P5110_02825 [Candidatus Omnitrophota bacterium]|nr:hypothetical protein [Candidatus Omnitrophota bacterium]HRZ14422.1 hypothetical protein [Candidatus Omnitrophota bacterium]
MRESVENLLDEAAEWCRGKNWLARLPLLVYFVYVLFRQLADPVYTSVLGGINLGIHELGHLVFMPLGQTMGVAGGTILQLAIPVFAIFNFYRQKEFFGMALSFGWISTNLFYIATYLADARRLELPMVTPFGGDNVIHDWEYLLSEMNVLQYDTAIATGIRGVAVVTMLVCFTAGAWLLWKMAVNKNLVDKTVK